LGSLQQIPSNPLPKESNRLNSHLQDLTQNLQNMNLTKIPQNFRSKRRSGFEDYVTEVGSKIGRLDYKRSWFLGEKPYRNKKKNGAAEREMGVLPSLKQTPSGRASQAVQLLLKWGVGLTHDRHRLDEHCLPSGRAPMKGRSDAHNIASRRAMYIYIFLHYFLIYSIAIPFLLFST
jgi:hypothetical protein